VESVLDLPPEEARRRVPLTVGALEPEAEGVRLTLEVDDLEWAARYLVGLDCRFTVRRPPELRETIRRLAAALVDACNVSALPAV
jgi:predicted DNA-binding transcriptional regulator YafY